MTSLSSTLGRYVSSEGFLGTAKPAGKRGPRLANRAALLRQLSADIGDSKSVLAIWLGMNIAVFALLWAALFLRLVQPYVAFPSGGISLVLLMRRLESVWREMRLQQLALNTALVCRDESLLRELMTNLNAALLLNAKTSAALLESEDKAVGAVDEAAVARLSRRAPRRASE